MRSWSVVAAWMVVSLAASASPVLAQEGETEAADGMTVIMTDPAADVGVDLSGTAAILPAENARAVDVTTLAMKETKTTFVFSLGLVDVTPDKGDATMYAQNSIRFRHGEMTYAVTFNGFYATGDPFYWADLSLFDPGTGEFNDIADLEVTVRIAENRLETEVQRTLLVDANGAAPFPGRVLEGFHVVSAGNQMQGGFNAEGNAVDYPELSDRMPDRGEAADVFEVQLGLKQDGIAHLGSDEPFRFSNGEATTFVFRVAATNLGSRSDTFAFEVVDVPSLWDVQMPAWTLAIDGETTLDLPVIVTTPFSHSHGDIESFVLEMHSFTDDDSVGRLRIGVNYPAIPQPAGHHDTLYFHVQDDANSAAAKTFATVNDLRGEPTEFKDLYMNALQEDETAEPVPMEGQMCRFGIRSNIGGDPHSGFCWYIPLAPALLMGLDFDLANQGQLDFVISHTVPVLQGSLSGRLEYGLPIPEDELNNTERRNFDRTEWTILANIGPTPEADMGASASTTFSLPITMLPEADLIRYERGSSLRLVLELSGVRPDASFVMPRDEPLLMPGGQMLLPLFEYADPVDDLLSFNSAVHLQSVGPQDRFANPGETVIYRFDVHNMGAETDRIQLTLLGERAQWATFLDGDRFDIPADGGATARIAVAIPAGASDGDLVDLVLEATSDSDANSRSLARFVTTVDEDRDHPDESELAIGSAGAKEAPGPLAVVLMLSILALAWVAKRRS